jgi:MFS family permease
MRSVAATCSVATPSISRPWRSRSLMRFSLLGHRIAFNKCARFALFRIGRRCCHSRRDERLTSHIHRHGLAIILTAMGWGAAIALAGIMPSLWLILLFLAIAGGADMVSGIFRSTLWNQTIPDELRGRLAGIELLSYTSGPTLGNARAGSVAAFGGVRPAIWSGGLICMSAVATLAAVLPSFRRYDSRTDPYAAARREAHGGTGPVRHHCR